MSLSAHRTASHDQVDTLKVFVIGFQSTERRLVDGVVMLSQRRNPRLQLVREAEAQQADAFLIDAADREAMAWAKQNRWLHDRTVIWVDSRDEPRAEHTALRRPVSWTALSIILASALEKTSRAEEARAAQAPSAVAPATVESSSLLSLKPDALTASTEPVPQMPQVLVVDDSLAVRNHLESLLKAHGMAVKTVVDGEEALAAVGAREFCCVLLDVLMPGMDGYETCRRIKGTRRGKTPLPVIMLTSKSSSFDRIRGKMSGCDAYLTKPVDPDALRTTLARFVTVAPQRAVSSGRGH